MVALLGLTMPRLQAKDLVVYFSATGNTQRVAEEIARLTGADILRIEAAEPYAEDPYDDSDRIQNEAYNDLRPAVANLPDAETVAQYDRFFVGSPIWWHQPAMVVCTFLEAYDLKDKIIVPFFTYGATTYLNESMQKIYKVTPNSVHIPETLPEDLDADDITTPGRSDDNGIDMPANTGGTEEWLKKLGLLGNETSVVSAETDGANLVRFRQTGNTVRIDVAGSVADSKVEIYDLNGVLVERMENSRQYVFRMPRNAVYLVSVTDGQNQRLYREKISL